MKKYLLMKMTKSQTKFSSIQNSFRLKIYKNNSDSNSEKYDSWIKSLTIWKCLKNLWKNRKQKEEIFWLLLCWVKQVRIYEIEFVFGIEY